MAGRKNGAKPPTCIAELGDGSRCRTVATAGGELCDYHAINAAEPPADPWGDETLADDAEPPAGSKSRRGPVSDVRAALREDAAAQYDKLADFFAEALEAERDTFATCSGCRKRVLVKVPDWTARGTIVRLMLEQGFGRVPPEDTNSGGSRLSEILESLSADELRALEIADYLLAGSHGAADKIADARALLDEIELAIAAGEVFMPGRGWVAREDVTAGEANALALKLDRNETLAGFFYEELGCHSATREKALR